MKKQVILFAQIIALVIIPCAAYGQLGSQSFPAVNFSDNTVTAAEISVMETEMSQPGLLPDNPMYIFKRFGEAVQMTLTFDPKKKAELHLEFAKNRLAEAKKMIDNNKTTEAKNAVEDYSKEIDDFENVSSGIGRNVSSFIKANDNLLVKSTFVLGMVYDKVPDEAKPAIENALNNSIEHIVRATERVENKTDKNYTEAIEAVIEREYTRSMQFRHSENLATVNATIVGEHRDNEAGDKKHWDITSVKGGGVHDSTASVSINKANTVVENGTTGKTVVNALVRVDNSEKTQTAVRVTTASSSSGKVV
ncbi:MAG: DUF5667 domain-containing protein [Candidatus Aenigmatarchaeota archaeon]